MTPKKMSDVAATAAVSILIFAFAISPALAQSSQTQSQQATFAVQMAEAAQSYAKNVVSIGQQHDVNVSQAISFVGEGDQLLAKAQGELGTNSTLAIRDALGAMKYYHAAVQSVISQAVTLFQEQSEAEMIARAQRYVARLQNRTEYVGGVLAKACSVPGASNATCADGKNNLAEASTDLSQAATLLASPNPDLTEVKSLITGAIQHLQQAERDINQLATAAKAQQAIQYIQNTLEPRITQLQQYAQKANLSSSVLQQVNSLLSNAQTDLSNAIQAFQSGSFQTGVQDAQQAIQLMQQAATLIQENAHH